MARFTEHKRENIDATVERWKEQCLLGDGSLVFEDRSDVWSDANVAELVRRFNENQLEGDAEGGTFATKWAAQLEHASEDVLLLAAEVLLVHFLFVSSVRKSKKLDVIGQALQGTG